MQNRDLIGYLAMNTKQTRIRIGTSSFSSKDWVGPFYPRDLKPSEFLAYYSQHFDTVEVDATYYRIPSKAMVAGWNENTPGDFLLSAKFPRSIVHAGEKSVPDADKLLSPDSTYDLRDSFLEVMSGLENKLGTLVLQFPYFSQKVFSHKELFYEKLQRFLEDLPLGFNYGVEIRNRYWLTKDFISMLKEHDTALVLSDQAWMPHGDEIMQKFDPVTSDHVYIRLIGDRKEIEALTKSWDKEVLDRTESLTRWVDVLAQIYRRQINSLVYINNHYAGHAPVTARTLSGMLNKSVLSG